MIGATLVRESYWVEYAKQYAEDIGVYSPDYYSVDPNSWPFNHIDWDAAAQELLVDYTEITFDGVTYYVR